MHESNADRLRAHFDAANRRDLPAAMAGYADDVELVVPPPWIYSDVFSGKEAVGRFFGDWFRTFDGGPHFELLDLCDAGDAVALRARATARGSRSGVELSDEYFYVYRFRDGLIRHVQFYDDWSHALAAAGVAS